MNILTTIWYAFLYFLVIVLALTIIISLDLVIENLGEMVFLKYGSGWTVALCFILGAPIVSFFFLLVSGISYLSSNLLTRLLVKGYDRELNFFPIAVIITTLVSLFFVYKMIISPFYPLPYLGIILKATFIIAVVLFDGVLIMTSKPGQS